MAETSNILKSLPGVPRQPLTPTQQLEALRRVQAQAEQRIKLGTQLFKAAEAHATQQKVLIDEVRQDQQRLRAEVQEDVARSLQAYDQWVGRIDENFTRAMQSLEAKIARLESQWTATADRMEALMRRAEALLEQSRSMLEAAQQVQPMVIEEEEAPIEADLKPNRPLRSPLAIKLTPPGKLTSPGQDTRQPTPSLTPKVTLQFPRTSVRPPQASTASPATPAGDSTESAAPAELAELAELATTGATDIVAPSPAAAEPSTEAQVPPADAISYSAILRKIRRGAKDDSQPAAPTEQAS